MKTLRRFLKLMYGVLGLIIGAVLIFSDAIYLSRTLDVAVGIGIWINSAKLFYRFYRHRQEMKLQLK